MAIKKNKSLFKVIFRFMSPKEEKLVFPELPLHFYIFLLFLDTTLANTEVSCEGLWGQWRGGLGEVPFWYLL